MNGSWGYRMRDQNYKSVDELIRYLVSTAGRDANLLLNVGPQPDGNIPAAALERLAAMGEWLAVNGETIYGTRSTLVEPQPWGVTTHKDNKMWLHVFPEDAFKNSWPSSSTRKASSSPSLPTCPPTPPTTSSKSPSDDFLQKW